MSACDISEERAIDDADRATGKKKPTVELAKNMNELISGPANLLTVYSGISGFFAETDVVHLSEQSLAAIKDIVVGVTTEWGFEQYENDLVGLTDAIRLYAPPDCDLATDGTDCQNVYNTASLKVYDLAGQASDVWASFNSEGDLHAANRMQYVPSMTTIAATEISLIQEMARLDLDRGFNGPSSYETLCSEASYYHDRLVRLKNEEYDEYIRGQFGAIEYSKKKNYSDATSWEEVYSFCFTQPDTPDYPDGKWCHSWVVNCPKGNCQSSPNKEENRKIAENERARQIDAFSEEQASTILGTPEFDEFVEQLGEIAECQGPVCAEIEVQGGWDNFGGTYTRRAENYGDQFVWEKFHPDEVVLPSNYIFWRQNEGKWVLSKSLNEVHGYFYETDGDTPFDADWVSEVVSDDDYPISSVSCSAWE